MTFFQLLRRIPFRFNTVEYHHKWNHHTDKLMPESAEDPPAANFSIEMRGRWFFKNKGMQSLIQNLSILKSCFFYQPTLIPEKSNNFVYLRIPKAGSSTIISMLAFGLEERINLDDIEQAAFHYKLHFNNRHWQQLQPFTVVRNPFARLVSAYLDTFKDDESFHQTYDCYFFGLVDRKTEFEEFVDYLSAIPDPLKLDHFKPQTSIIKSQGFQKLRVFKIETQMANLVEFLGGDQNSLPHLNASKVYDFKKYYSQNSFEKASRIYRKDIETFGYHSEYQELKDFLAKHKTPS